MTALDLGRLSKDYRDIRKAVYEEATRPLIGAADRHSANQLLLRQRVTDICDKANLERYRQDNPETASAIWRHLWTINRYAGIRARQASREIKEIEFAFDDFDRFTSPSSRRTLVTVTVSTTSTRTRFNIAVTPVVTSRQVSVSTA